MIRFFTLLIILIPFTAFCPALKKPDVIVKTEAEKMITDNIGNVYLVKGETISKYDSAGVLQKTFSNKNFGSITSADATNALRIVLFYKDFNRIVTLDNTMSQNGEPLTLETIGFPLVSLIASSHDNGLWIYDQANFELIRLNRNLQVENRSGNLSQILGIELQPNFIIEKDNRLFLNNPSTGILIFDVFGTYSKTLGIKNLKRFQVVDDAIVYFDKGNLVSESIPVNNTVLFTEPSDTSALDMRMEKNAVFVLKKNAMEIYKK